MNRFDSSIEPNAENTSGGTGYLVVRVATARGAIPLENAAVTVRVATEGDGDGSKGALVASMYTDRDGLAPRLSLPAPPRSESESPGGVRPFSLYDIEVFLEGYTSNYYGSVPIFDTVTSVQTVDLIPLPEGARPELSVDPPSLFFRSAENLFPES